MVDQPSPLVLLWFTRKTTRTTKAKRIKHEQKAKSDIRLKSLKGMQQKFHFWGQDLFRCVLKVYLSDFVRDMPTPLYIDIYIYILFQSTLNILSLLSYYMRFFSFSGFHSIIFRKWRFICVNEGFRMAANVKRFKL